MQIKEITESLGRDFRKKRKDKEKLIAADATFPESYISTSGWKFYTRRQEFHALARSVQRAKRLEEKDWIEIHERVNDDIIKNNRPETKYYLYYSREYNIAYICDLKRSKKEVKILTVLPRGHKDPEKGSRRNKPTERVIIESVQNVILDVLFKYGLYEYVELK